MTVKELMRRLERAPDDAMVVLSSDGEGNCISPLGNVTDERYVAENEWSGDLCPDPQMSVPVIALWPTN